MTAPLLVDFGPQKPTTRDIAKAVKDGGVGALTDARLRADHARYQEITCRSALNKVEGMPFRWTLNPYRGCTHGCHYCFARRYHVQFEMNVDDEFASVILVKTNLVEVLARELDRPAWRREVVAVGTATDPYQPIEGHYKLTRRSLEVLARSRTPIGLVTKGPMAVRDKDLFVELARVASCTVCFSVPTVDEDLWRTLEPGTAHPLQRLRAVRELREAGVNAGVLIAPVVPGLTSQPARLERTIKAVAEHGAAFAGMNLLYLKDGTRTHFLAYLAREFPDLVPKYAKLYRGAYAPSAYVSQVKAIVRLLQDRYGLTPRKRTPLEEQEPEPPRQGAFEW